MVTATVVACEPEAAVPVTVSVKLPAAVAVVVEMVKVELAPEVTEAGENEAVTPAGAPEAVSEIVCALPEVVALLMVTEPENPAAMLTLVGLAAMEKSLATTGLMTKLTAVECVAEAPVPVTVIA